MLSGRRFFQLAAVLFLAVFCFGLVRLLQLRFSVGDIFPPYSSLRADPLGAKVFYESLRALPAYTTGRNERKLDHLGRGEGVVLFLLGVKGVNFSEKEREALDHFLQTGGRLVLTFFPTREAPPRKTAETATPTPKPSATPEPTPKHASLKDILLQWEVETGTSRNDEKDSAVSQSTLPLEKVLSWHSGIFFRPKSDAWHTIYQSDRGPVVLERSLGAGSIVLASDSYFVSNEALLVERAPALLAWLVGSARHIIFDESHLNIRERPGVATLLRRHGLGGFVAGFLILVMLWLWRNTTFTLAPRASARRSDEIVSGRDSFTGFVHLLRRGPAPKELLSVCLDEWAKSSRSSKGNCAPDLGALSAAIEKDHPVTAYNKITELLRPKKWKTTN
jgi:hypothetical protein